MFFDSLTLVLEDDESFFKSVNTGLFTKATDDGPLDKLIDCDDEDDEADADELVTGLDKLYENEDVDDGDEEEDDEDEDGRDDDV